tara:strand:+ start:1582 stop:1791 length:210 start_codon:yes stop_codon:yes gene_type:complete
MGFHKRRITKEGFLHTYEEKGLEGIKRYYSADALFFSVDEDGEKLSRIHHLLLEKEYDKIEDVVKLLKS